MGIQSLNGLRDDIRNSEYKEFPSNEEDWVMPVSQNSYTTLKSHDAVSTTLTGTNSGNIWPGYTGDSFIGGTDLGGGLLSNYCYLCNNYKSMCACSGYSPWKPWSGSFVTPTENEQRQKEIADLKKTVEELAGKLTEREYSIEQLSKRQDKAEDYMLAVERKIVAVERRKDHETSLKLAAEAVSEKLRRQLAPENKLQSGDVVFTKTENAKMIAVQPTRLTATEKHPDGPDKGAGERRLPLVIEDAWSCHDGKQFVAVPAALLEKRKHAPVSHLPYSHILTAMATFVATLGAVFGASMAYMMF